MYLSVFYSLKLNRVLNCPQSIGHVSGCHINPAVTLGFLVVGELSLIKSILYIGIQCVGAIAGIGLLQVSFSQATQPHPLPPVSDSLTLHITICRPFYLSI